MPHQLRKQLLRESFLRRKNLQSHRDIRTFRLANGVSKSHNSSLERAWIPDLCEALISWSDGQERRPFSEDTRMRVARFSVCVLPARSPLRKYLSWWTKALVVSAPVSLREEPGMRYYCRRLKASASFLPAELGSAASHVSVTAHNNAGEKYSAHRLSPNVCTAE